MLGMRRLSTLASRGALTPMELLAKYGVGTLTLPLGLVFGWTDVKPKCQGVLTYFGKFQKTYDTGLVCVPWIIGASLTEVYVGPDTFKLENMRVLDARGNPLITSIVVHCHISDVASFFLVYQRNLQIVKNRAEIVLRECISKYTYDELIAGQAVNDALQQALQTALDDAGVQIDSFSIGELQYAPEIAASMLVKQQAQAYVTAKQHVVEGVILTVKDVLKEFPDLSREAQEKLVVNLVPVLASGQSVQSVITVNQ